MMSRDQRSDESSFFDALAGALGGFVREFRKGLGETATAAEQTLVTAQAEVDTLQEAVTGLTQAVAQGQQEVAQSQQVVLDTLARIAERVEQIHERVAALEEAGKPEEAARWRALLKRLGEIALLLVGPTAVAAALRDALVENELYPALRDRLLNLLTQGETVVEAAAVPPAPTPAAPAPTPAPAEVRTPAPEEIEAARQGEVWPEKGPIGFDWVTIPAGEFLMGSDPRVDRDAEEDEQPQHRVWLPAYQIARAPVTNRQFVAFLTATRYETDRERARSDYVWYQPDGPGSKLTAAKGEHPVRCVTWNDAQAFCAWAKVRLPTEAEWEKAARGPDGRLYPWGNQRPDRTRCNYDRNMGGTTPVGHYPAGASPYGVLDMAGNVYEWCSDWWDGRVYQARAGKVTRAPVGPGSGVYRVLRGGSWWSPPQYVRCAYRYWYGPDVRFDYFGFRVARGSLR